MNSPSPRRQRLTEINTSSMADIAFLLLIFFLVTTTIQSEKGLMMLLPPITEQVDFKIQERNLFKVMLNGNDQLTAEDQMIQLPQLRMEIKKFLTNQGQNPNYSDNPDKAIVSLQCSRSTGYDAYIEVLDEIKRAYNEVRAAHVGLSLGEYQRLDDRLPSQRELLEKAKTAYPMQISEANPLAF